MLVAFDLDDTLYLERDYVRSGFEHVGRWAEAHLGVADFADRAWRQFEIGGRGDIFDRVLASYEIKTDGVLPELVRLYREHRPSISLLHDSQLCLEALRPHATLAIISDGPLQMQSNKVRVLDLERAVDEIVLTGQWGREFWKPHVRAFEYVQRQFAVPAEQCIYIGDNPTKDFIAPRRLGWRTLRIRRVGGLHSHVEAAGTCAADSEAEDLQAAVSTLVGSEMSAARPRT